MTSPLRAPAAQSLSVRVSRKTICALEPQQQMWSLQQGRKGSQVKAHNNRQSCAMQNPWTRDTLAFVWKGLASACLGAMRLPSYYFLRFVLAQVVRFTAHLYNLISLAKWMSPLKNKKCALKPTSLRVTFSNTCALWRIPPPPPPLYIFLIFQ